MAGIPERTYRRLAKLRAGDETIKGPWPSPAVDAVEALAAKYASDWPAWGHREIAATMRADGHDVSTSTVERALRQRGLLLPRGFRADRKSWAVLRRKVFHDPPTERNRVWQTAFSELETPSGGICRICAVIDHATKYCLAAKVTPTARGADAPDESTSTTTPRVLTRGTYDHAPTPKAQWCRPEHNASRTSWPRGHPRRSSVRP